MVAVAWLAVFAKTWRLVYHPWEAYVALALVVWVIYVTDRLIDVSLRKGTPERCEPRHFFHWKYRKIFAIGSAVASVIALFLVIRFMPYPIFGYLFAGGIIVGGFFGLSMLSQQGPDEIPYLKNIMAGLGFAYGVALLASVYNPSADFYQTMRSREIICFAVLCIMNISAIDLWEHANRSHDVEVKATDELALTLPLALLGLAAIVFAYQANPHPEDAADYGLVTRSFFYAILTGAALLYVLNRARNRFHMDTLRVLADVALLIPVLVFFAFSKEPLG